MGNQRRTPTRHFLPKMEKSDVRAARSADGIQGGTYPRSVRLRNRQRVHEDVHYDGMPWKGQKSNIAHSSE